MEELYAAISKQQACYPVAVFIIAGDFNHSNLKTVLPKYYQHVSCPPRGDKTLDHNYTNINDAYKALPLPGQSDHGPKPSVRTVKVWPEGAEPILQHRLHHSNWSNFAAASPLDSQINIDSFTSSVLDCINTYINDATTNRITFFPNQKTWMDGQVCLLLKVCDTTHRSGPAQVYSLARADLRRGIKSAKHSHKLNVQEYVKDSDPRRMWQGLKAITDFKTSRTSPRLLTPPYHPS